MFWPTFSCQILIIFSFLENLWHKETDLTSFAKKFLQINCILYVKGNLHIFIFLNYKSGYLKFSKIFCIFEMAWSRAFQKCINYHFLDNFFLHILVFLNHTSSYLKFWNFFRIFKMAWSRTFLYIWILQKKNQFLQIYYF